MKQASIQHPTRLLISLALLLNLALINFAPTSTVYAQGTNQETNQETEWSYEGDTGPDHWGELSPDFELCESGMEQSPVDIARSAPTNPADLQFNYQPSALVLLNNGETVVANYAPGSTVNIDGTDYTLQQFHFHNPSEHTVDGATTPMELHLVHSDETGALAVIGILIEEGAENSALAPVFENMPTGPSVPITVTGGVLINAADLLPADPTYWRYNGSLTTPPCSEGVKWHVMTNPIEASAEQIASFTDLFSENARPTQPWNNRDFILVTGSWSQIPTSEATQEPGEEATVEPTEEATAETMATVEATEEPTAEAAATPESTEEATATSEPTEEPTEEPTAESAATPQPTEEPTEETTVEATEEATVEATEEPTEEAAAAQTTVTPEVMPVTGAGQNPLAIAGVIGGTLLILVAITTVSRKRKTEG